MVGGCHIEASAEDLLAQARNLTGINIVDEDAVEPLTVIIDAFNRDELHEEGAKSAERHLLRILANRLRMQRDFRAHPEIEEQVVKSPIIIWGLTRTGSTKTQKLLAASGDFNFLPFWQSINPALYTGSRDESPQPRIDSAESFTHWLHESAPETKNIHNISTFEPEEESFIQMQSLRTQVFTGYSNIGSYMSWLSSQDMKCQIEYVKKTLKYLQWQGLQSEGRRWVLKSPLYLGTENELLEVFPDACLVMTHRHPDAVIPSTCSLWKSFRKPYTDAAIDYVPMMQGIAYVLNQHLEFRKRRPEIRILDIGYGDVVSGAEGVVEKIYEFSGEKLNVESQKKMAQWNEKNSKGKSSGHKYSLEEFGLTASAVDEHYKSYIEFLKEKKFI